MVLIYLLLALAAVAYYFYFGLKKTFSYWKDRGVTQFNPNFIYGDFKDVAAHKTSPAELFCEFYYAFKKMGVKHGGVYASNRPNWVPVDPSLIKCIVTKDFQHFAAHHPPMGNSLILNSLFHMHGEPWKNMRRKLTPTFTSGKMKMMYDMMLQKADGLTKLVGQVAKSGKSTEIKGLVARYTTDGIGTCGFGIECDSLNDENSEFYQKGQEMFRKFVPKKPVPLSKLILGSLGLLKLKLPFDISEIEDFFRQMVVATVKYREENKVVRKDFLHLMIQLKNKGTITDIVNEKDVFKSSGEEDGLSMEDLAGQCLLFFTAGFETSSTTMSFAILELTQNLEVQDKLRKEVREVLKKHNGVLSYDALQEMTFCENVIYETLRKYPPLANLPRICTKDYHVPNSDIVIEKGTIVGIPLLAIQNDPEYFPQPEKFIPERFAPENKCKIVDHTFMPFGEGPRQCLGLRFGVLQSKAGLASLINRFSFTLNRKTPYPPKFVPAAPILTVENGIWVEVKQVQ